MIGWSNDELEMKKNIERCAYEELQRMLCEWWSQQCINKSKNEKYKIEPFLIWKKRRH